MACDERVNRRSSSQDRRARPHRAAWILPPPLAQGTDRLIRDRFRLGQQEKAELMKTRFLTIAAAAAVLCYGAGAASATTLDDVKKKGFVQCGVNTGLLGFGSTNDAGDWPDFDVDYCRAVAVPIFNDKTKVKFSPL